MPKGIFLSHSHLDKDFARKLFFELQSREIKVWFDEAELQPGDSLIGKVEQAIDEMDYLGVILSSHSVESEWVQREVRMALTEEIKGRTVKVFPLLIDNCKIPGFIRDKLFVDFRDRSDESFQEGVVLLVRTLRGEKPDLVKSKRVEFSERLQEVPEEAKAFGLGKRVPKAEILSLSRTLTDREFDALHDLAIWRDREDHGSRGIRRSQAARRIGGPEWEARKVFEQLVELGFLILVVPPNNRYSDPGYEYTSLFWIYTNLIRHLGIGDFVPEKGPTGTKYWLS
jgi:hypothetical protein